MGWINQGSNPVLGPSRCTGLLGPRLKFKVIVKAQTEGLLFWAIPVLELGLVFGARYLAAQCGPGLTSSFLPCSSA